MEKVLGGVTSFQVLVLFDFLTPSTAPGYSFRYTRVIASLTKLLMSFYISLAASNMHLKMTVTV